MTDLDRQCEITDAQRLDWLERMAAEPDGILLHDGYQSGRLGLGMKRFGRTLREAIDQCIRTEGNGDE